MIRKINTKGQAALILILLAAAAMIFYAITLNWGRMAQSKSLLTIAANQSAALLASEIASYGEMQKEQNLQDTNQIQGLSPILMDIIGVLVAIVCLIITICTYGSGATIWGVFAIVMAALAVVMAIVVLALQLTVIQPGITALWNKIQKNEPIEQQFFEQGITTALEGIVTDQVNVTDYLDWNANGSFGLDSNKLAKDSVGRFAVFYGDRLKMLNKDDNPAVVFFYNQLNELVNGETCAQNVSDHNSTDHNYATTSVPDPPTYGSLIALNPACSSATLGENCSAAPTDAVCQMKVGFQLSDPCNNSGAYSPYCDPCCQVAQVLDPLYSPGNPLHPTQYKSVRPANCPPDLFIGNTDMTAPAQCWTNNAYSDLPTSSNPNPGYPLLYDPTYQNYANGTSFLDLFGRDQQMGPFSSTLTPQGSFPNGIYPFFWLMNDYSPQVDNINPLTTPPNASSPALHWCVAANVNGTNIPTFNTPTGFSDLDQLTLPYACQGQDCCINYLPDGISNAVTVASNPISITIGGGPQVSVLVTDTTQSTGTVYVGDDISIAVKASENDGSITNISLTGSTGNQLTGGTYSVTLPATSSTYTYTNTAATEGTFTLNASATDAAGITATASTTVTAETAPNTNTTTSTDTSTTTSAAVATIKLMQVSQTTPTACGPSTSTTSTPDLIITATDGKTSGCVFPTGDIVTLTATVSGTSTTIGQVSFYGLNNGVNSLLGTSTNTSSPYSITWNTTNYAGTYSVSAVATAVGSSTAPTSGSTINGQIDMVGDPSFAAMPSIAWVPGDNQLCSLNWPYNGSTASAPDGTCETTAPATEDTLDDVMHTLSDFLPFANSLLNQDVGTLSSTFNAWFPQAAQWIAPAGTEVCSNGSSCNSSGQCSDGSACGTADGRLLPLPGYLSAWSTQMSSWLNTKYMPTGATSANLWCVPQQSVLSGTTEGAYISSNSPGAAWGTLPTIIACENYNGAPATAGYGSQYNYQQCAQALANESTKCTTFPPACAASILGRSLLTGAVPTFTAGASSTSCSTGTTGSYAQWVQNSYDLAYDEAPKFALRSAYLSDVYTRASNLQQISSQASTALTQFINGPAAQLIAAHGQTLPAGTYPNAVIYGWVDNLPSGSSGGCRDTNNNPVGCAHIVKVTAYSPGYGGSAGQMVLSSLPVITTSSDFLYRYFTLSSRDGNVYVRVRRWDQDRSSSVLFPNGHSLWQYLFHVPGSPNTTPDTVGKNFATCSGLKLPSPCSGSCLIGFGLEQGTLQGLVNGGILTGKPGKIDIQNLANAFMLNDEGASNDGKESGLVDTYALAFNPGGYNSCLGWANNMLGYGAESHACARYIASSPASDPGSVKSGNSGTGDSDYSLKFVNCSDVDGGSLPDDDLDYAGNLG